MQNNCGPALGEVVRDGRCRGGAFKLILRNEKKLGRGRVGGKIFHLGRRNSKC